MWRYCGSTPLLVSVHLKQTATGWCVIPVIAKVVQQVVPVQQCKVVLSFVLAKLVFNKAAYGLWRIVLTSVGFPFFSPTYTLSASHSLNTSYVLRLRPIFHRIHHQLQRMRSAMEDVGVWSCYIYLWSIRNWLRETKRNRKSIMFWVAVEPLACQKNIQEYGGFLK